jgi:hypothetical protein
MVNNEYVQPLMAANIDNYQPSMEGFNVPVPVPFVDHEKLLEESTMLNN